MITEKMILKSLPKVLKTIDLPLGKKLQGKVRDIYFKDKKCRFILVNRAYANSAGLKPEEIIGKTDFDIFPSERANRMFKDDLYVLNTGRPIIDKIERATRPDGIDNYVSTTKIPVYDGKGRAIGLLGITRDITRRVQIENIRKESSLSTRN